MARCNNPQVAGTVCYLECNSFSTMQCCKVAPEERITCKYRTEKIPKYVVYESRYNIDPDSACVIDTAETNQEAEKIAKNYPGSVIVRQEAI